ncbi:MAG: DUF2807 domain-containing protein [Bacteroidota bacterium]
MKKYTILLFTILFTSIAFSQKRAKISGSKVVTTEQKEIGAFENLEIEDNLEVSLVKGDKCGIEIDADENLHKEINISLNGNTLRLTTAKEIVSFKKLNIKITYTDDFKMLIAKHSSSITALSDLKLDNITIKCFDYSKIFVNVKSKSFTLMANDKSKIELNLLSEETTIELSKNAQIKALLATGKLKFDMYQKSSATVEGDIADMKLRTDNSTTFNGKNLTVKTAEILCESDSKLEVNVTSKAIVEASGKSEIQFYGDGKVELKKFADNAVIMKKSLKLK